MLEQAKNDWVRTQRALHPFKSLSDTVDEGLYSSVLRHFLDSPAIKSPRLLSD